MDYYKDEFLLSAIATAILSHCSFGLGNLVFCTCIYHVYCSMNKWVWNRKTASIQTVAEYAMS